MHHVIRTRPSSRRLRSQGALVMCSQGALSCQYEGCTAAGTMGMSYLPSLPGGFNRKGTCIGETLDRGGTRGACCGCMGCGTGVRGGSPNGSTGTVPSRALCRAGVAGLASTITLRQMGQVTAEPSLRAFCQRLQQDRHTQCPHARVCKGD